MTHRTFPRMAATLAAALMLTAALVPPASAQNEGTAFYVGDDPTGRAGDFGVPDTDAFLTADLQNAVDAAVERSRTLGQRVDVFLEQGTAVPYPGFDIPADAHVHVIGAAVGADSFPWEAVIDGDVLIHTDTAADPPYQAPADPADPNGTLARMVIEGLTITGGVLVHGTGVDGDAPVRPTISRCIVENGGGAGIEARDNAAPFIVNCTVRNSATGILVSNPLITTADFFTDVAFCTIFGNSDGVFVENDGDARVRNTIVFDNTDRGIAWESNPAIDPDNGPWDVNTPVDIFGSGLAGADGTRVFFGPAHLAETEALNVTANDTLIQCETPVSYLGAPVTVDVTIVRDDGGKLSTIVLPDAFTYTASAGNPPLVTRADPARGPVGVATGGDERQGVWTFLHGAQFDPGAAVYFDVDDDGARSAGDLPSEDVRWLSPSLLYVLVPPHTAPIGPIDIFVENPNGDVSPAGVTKEWTYDATLVDPPPVISAVVPDAASTLTQELRLDVLVYGVQAGATVLIGGEVAPYLEVDTVEVPGRVRQVAIPSALHGAPGTYDVTVINPDGQQDTLPNAFTWFGQSAPVLEPETLGGATLDWRVANFASATAGPPLTRELLGAGFDTGLDIAFGSETITGVLPHEAAGAHVRHDQRTITFDFLTIPYGAAGRDVVDVTVTNVRDVDGDVTEPTGTTTRKTVSTQFAWVDPPEVFAVANVRTETGALGYTATPDPAVLTDWYASIDEAAANWGLYGADAQVFIAGVEMTTQVIGNRIALNPPDDGTGVPDWPEGAYGPQDVVMVVPGASNTSGIALYYVAEDAIYLPRTDSAGNLVPPHVHAVEPNVVAQTGGEVITVRGSDFLGPYAPLNAGDPAPAQWENAEGEVYTRVSIVDNVSGTVYPLIPAAGGPEVAVASYEVMSSAEIAFTLRDLTAVAPYNAIPLDTPLDVLVEHVDPQGTPVSDSTVLADALVLTNAARPAIIDLYRADPAPPPSIRYGSVAGGDVVVLEGTDLTGANPVRVLFDGVEGRVVSEAPSRVEAVAPPAPLGRAGAVEVTLLREEPLPSGDPVVFEAVSPVPYTYIQDGSPVITSISPSYVDRAESENPATSDEGLYLTIRGFNFPRNPRVLFVREGRIVHTLAGVAVESASPYEILVRAPASDTDLGLTDADYTDASGSVPVAVAIEPAGLTDAANARSNDVDVLYQEGVDPLEPAAPVLVFNNVHRNPGGNYVNVAPGAGSISIDPWLVRPPVAPDTWEGALRTEVTEQGAFNPMIDQAGEFQMGPYGNEDLELDGRPRNPTYIDGPSGFDIGADEAEVAAEEVGWYFCEVTPDPAGALGAGELEVKFRLRGATLDLADAAIVDETICVMPQGGMEAAIKAAGRFATTGELWQAMLERSIRMDLKLDINEQLLFAENSEPITTVVYRDPNSNTGAGPQQGDVIADGHAEVFIRIGDEILGYDSGGVTDAFLSTDLTDGGKITEQAVTGRHFLIDTIPPRIHVETYVTENTDLQNRLVLPWHLVTESNDTYDVTDLGTTPVRHFAPFPNRLYPAALPGAVWWEQPGFGFIGATGNVSPVVEWPIEWQGGLLNTFLVDGALPEPRKAQIFFNTGSVSNGLADPAAPLPEDNLTLTIEVQFIDPVVTVSGDRPVPYWDEDNVMIAGSLRDATSNPAGLAGTNNRSFSTVFNGVPLDTREVAGFAGADISDDADLLFDSGSEAYWVSPDALNVLFGDFNATIDLVDSETERLTEDAVPSLPKRVSDAVDINGRTVTASVDSDQQVGANVGFDRTSPSRAVPASDDLLTPAPNVLRKTWVITDLDWARAHTKALATQLQFAARDRAGNTPAVDVLLQPLHVYWATEVQSEISGLPEATDVFSNQSFTLQWDLVRGNLGGTGAGPTTMASPEVSTANDGGPRPAFKYSIYANLNTVGQDREVAYEGTYTHIYTTPEWTLGQRITNREILEILRNNDLAPDTNNYWVLLVVHGMDEAGNIEPWYTEVPWFTDSGPELGNPGDSLFPGDPFVPIEFAETGGTAGERRSSWAGTEVAPLAAPYSLPNMLRFRLVGGERPDTTGRVSFWYRGATEQNLGTNPYVVMPPANANTVVEADFLLEAIFPETDDLWIRWELLENGRRVANGDTDVSGSAGRMRLAVPSGLTADVLDGPWALTGVPNTLGDPSRRQERRYTLRASAYVDEDGSDSLTQGDPVDPTWVNIPFTVTPYMADPGADPDTQPIKIQEQQ